MRAAGQRTVARHNHHPRGLGRCHRSRGQPTAIFAAAGALRSAQGQAPQAGAGGTGQVMKGLGQADETRDQCRPLRAHALSPWDPSCSSSSSRTNSRPTNLSSTE